MPSQFKALRFKRGYSRKALAAAARCGVATVYGCQNGAVPYSPLLREALARALGVSEAELFGEAA
jgi:transcriptional regulator with XRE-family HTH domain